MGLSIREYTDLIARAFNGAVVVNGQRIAAHPSGTLLARASFDEERRRREAWERLNSQGRAVLDRENDWSDV